MLRPRRVGFTLIELLVVIAIIAILIGLLLPAIQKVREAADRSTCTNNLKQLGLGIQTFHDAFKRLPPGSSPNVPPLNATGYGSSWVVYIFPYIEQDPIWRQWQLTGTNTGWDNATNRNIPISGIGTLVCPSDPQPQLTTALGVPRLTGDYMAIAGAAPAALTGTGFTETRFNSSAGTGCCNMGMVSGGGPMPPNGRVRLGDIKDGTANTILVAEDSDYLIRTDGTLLDWRAVGGHGVAMGTSQTGVPPNYGNERAFSTSTVRYPINAKGPAPSYTGGWADDCSLGVCSNTGSATPIRSAHPGGANVAMCDGTVRFLKDATPLDALALLATRDDRKPIPSFD